jgi:transposase
VIRIDAVWLATEPMDMRAGTETALARVVRVFGAARPHHAYLFANKRATRMKGAGAQGRSNKTAPDITAHC